MQIDPFFAIAFDVDKSEVFTVSMQAVSASKATYKLNRYSYPDFAPKGDWKISQLGVRAALDTAGGKLYLATAPLSPATLAQKGDRVAGAGDILVYDLAGIRDKKVAERTELKSVAAVATGAPVRGLDVSPDGKVLTVLTSRAPVGGKGKAMLRQYDTADLKKVIKDKELPNAAWNLSRTADGKSLLVTEDPRAASQALLVCDPATLEPRPLSLPRGTTDVAVGPDGKMVAAAGASGGQAGELVVIAAAAAPKKLLATAGRKNQNGYARFTPDGKKLLVASHGMEQQNFAPGLDVYEVADPADPASYKKAGTIRSAGMQYVGGYFHVSPDGERVVIQLTGAVLETAKLTEHVGGPEPAGLDGNGGQPGPGRGGFAPPGQPGPGQPGPLPAPGQLGPGQPGPGQPNPAPGELGPGQPGPGRPAPGQLGPGQPGPGQPNPGVPARARRRGWTAPAAGAAPPCPPRASWGRVSPARVSRRPRGAGRGPGRPRRSPGRPRPALALTRTTDTIPAPG
ncbi:MAG: hypothetical protein U0804_04930 [Gemmataceae bacterium]